MLLLLLDFTCQREKLSLSTQKVMDMVWRACCPVSVSPQQFSLPVHPRHHVECMFTVVLFNVTGLVDRLLCSHANIKMYKIQAYVCMDMTHTVQSMSSSLMSHAVHCVRPTQMFIRFNISIIIPLFQLIVNTKSMHGHCPSSALSVRVQLQSVKTAVFYSLDIVIGIMIVFLRYLFCIALQRYVIDLFIAFVRAQIHLVHTLQMEFDIDN